MSDPRNDKLFKLFTPEQQKGFVAHYHKFKNYHKEQTEKHIMNQVDQILATKMK